MRSSTKRKISASANAIIKEAKHLRNRCYDEDVSKFHSIQNRLLSIEAEIHFIRYTLHNQPPLLTT